MVRQEGSAHLRGRCALHNSNRRVITLSRESHLTSEWKRRDSCVDPISRQRRAKSLEFSGRDFMKFTILIAVWRILLRSGSSVLDARASLWIMHAS